MIQTVDPKTLGLHPSTKIECSESNHFLIVIDRKSRLVMKDGEKILDKVSKIKTSIPDARVDVKTSAPVCGKTRGFLESHGVNVYSFG